MVVTGIKEDMLEKPADDLAVINEGRGEVFVLVIS